MAAQRTWCAAYAPLHRLAQVDSFASLIGIATAIGRRETTADAVTRGLLERIAARDPVVRAWSHLDTAGALAQAGARDAGTSAHSLHGVPVGVKDVFDTCDMPASYGSPIYAGYQPRSDAAVVALLRGMGGLVLGKTVTTEFATFTPNVTTNPHNPAHTPGGSSSGSAAAVAAGMVPVAFGTQTIGSVIRPAAYCGVVGYKPSFGLLPRTGVKAISECLDTVGCFTRSVADAAFFVGLAHLRELVERSTNLVARDLLEALGLEAGFESGALAQGLRAEQRGPVDVLRDARASGFVVVQSQ